MSTIFRSHVFAADVLANHAALEADVVIRSDVALFALRDAGTPQFPEHTR